MKSERLQIDSFHEEKDFGLNDYFISPGDRTYLIGTQNGGFPDFGHHIENEMGGIWNHPIKLLDGFWLQISEQIDGGRVKESTWLENANKFRSYPFFNEHQYKLKKLQLEVVRRQFCPDGLEGVVVTYRIVNLDPTAERRLKVSLLARIDLRPAWYSETMGIVDGEDDGRIDQSQGTFVGFDTQNPWYVVIGSDRYFQSARVNDQLFGPEKTAGKGTSGFLTYENIKVKPGDAVDIDFFIAGSYHSEMAARDTFMKLKTEHKQLFAQKRDRYQKIFEQSKVSLPDKHLEKVFHWVKFHNDWLIRNVPEVGRGLGAGLPEYPWWFGCDNSYALKGVLATGDFALAKNTLELIHDVSEKENANGRIIHEVSTCGAVSNKGNTQETPHFIICLWDYFLWTGNYSFLQSIYPTVKKGIQWLLGEMDSDGDLLPEGYGVIEIKGLNSELIDTAVYTYKALQVGAQMADLFNEVGTATKYREYAYKLMNTINDDLWLEEENLYADVIETPRNVLQQIDDFIKQAKESDAATAVCHLKNMKNRLTTLELDEQQPFLFKNWVINTPMEVGLAPKDKAVRALERLESEEFTGLWGMHLSGLYQTEMMTISTGVQAVAESQYDRMDETLRYINLIASTFGKKMPGSISEMSPDHGCFVQAWTNYGMIWPLITRIFGIQPNAYIKEITLRPRLPKAWNNISIENVAIGCGSKTNRINVSIARLKHGFVYHFSTQQQGWLLRINVPEKSKEGILIDGMLHKPHRVLNKEAIFEIPNAGEHQIQISES